MLKYISLKQKLRKGSLFVNFVTQNYADEKDSNG